MNPATRVDLPWHEIDTVLLDLDGTLLDLHFDNHFFGEHLPRRLAEERGVPLERAQAELDRCYHQVAGTLDWYCLDYWQRELRLDIVALKQEVGDRIRWRPHARAFVETLARARKWRVLATNAHPASLGLKFDRLDLDGRFDARYSAHDLGAPKEQSLFWDRLHARERFNPARTLFVDDNPQVLEAARAWGLEHLLGVRRPDSRRAANPLAGFNSVDDFDQVVPPQP